MTTYTGMCTQTCRASIVSNRRTHGLLIHVQVAIHTLCEMGAGWPWRRVAQGTKATGGSGNGDGEIAGCRGSICRHHDCRYLQDVQAAPCAYPCMLLSPRNCCRYAYPLKPLSVREETGRVFPLCDAVVARINTAVMRAQSILANPWSCSSAGTRLPHTGNWFRTYKICTSTLR